MSDSRTEVQVLVKHLLENPNDIATFQEDPQKALKTLKIANTSTEQLRTAIGIFTAAMGLDDIFCHRHLNHTDNGSHIDQVKRLQRVDIIANPVDFKIRTELKTDLSAQIFERAIGRETVVGRIDNVVQTKDTGTKIQQ